MLPLNLSAAKLLTDKLSGKDIMFVVCLANLVGRDSRETKREELHGLRQDSPALLTRALVTGEQRSMAASAKAIHKLQ